MSNVEKRLWIHPLIMNHHVPRCDPVSFCFPSQISTNTSVSQNKDSPKFIRTRFLFNETLANMCTWKGSIFVENIKSSIIWISLGLTLQCVVLQQVQKHGLTWQKTHSQFTALVLFDGALGWWLCGKATQKHWRAEILGPFCVWKTILNPWSCQLSIPSSWKLSTWPRYRYTFPALGWESHYMWKLILQVPVSPTWTRSWNQFVCHHRKGQAVI